MKRARQMVKKGRARWVTEDKICLLWQPEEEHIMVSDKTKAEVKAEDAALAAEINDKSLAQEIHDGSQAGVETTLMNDSALRDLAKRRLLAKRSLWGQLFDYLLIVLLALALPGLGYGGAIVLGFCFCAFWGLRLAWRWFKFMKPSFREGLAAYFRKRKEQQLEFEYSRLKRMRAEYVADELNR